MKSFWWYDEASIAGMARPGFNCTHWFDLPADEAGLLGWLGQYSSGDAPFSDLKHHVETYVPKILRFYKEDEDKIQQLCDRLQTPEGLTEVLGKLQERTQSIENFSVADDHVKIVFSEERLKEEISLLKKQGIQKVITLTEKHHGKEHLGEAFQLHHFSINDLEAPTLDQVLELAEVIKQAKKDNETLAVHCLAGIGRTSTMIIGAHLTMGEDFEGLQTKIKEKNPSFTLVGSQSEFLHKIAEQYA